MPQVATKQPRPRAPQKRAPAPRKGPARASRKRAQSDTKPRKANAQKTNGRMPKAGTTNERGGGQGGRRLAAAFDSVSRVPALVESCRRPLTSSERETSSPGELTQAIESDVALTIAVMRAAGNSADRGGRTGGVEQAIEALSPAGVREVVGSLDTYDPLESPNARA